MRGIMAAIYIINSLLAYFTLFAQGFILLFFLILIINKSFKLNIFPELFLFLKKNGMKLAFLVALASTLGSLYYSEIAQYEPCKYCWYARIFMFPQVLILGIALFKKENVKQYALALSVLGALLATYHYGIQVYGLINPAFEYACSAAGVSCASIEFIEFGYVTIPLMVLTAFLLIIIFMVQYQQEKKFFLRR